MGLHVRDGRRPAGSRGTAQQIRCPARGRKRSGDGAGEALDEGQGNRTGPVGRRHHGHDIERATRQRVELRTVVEQEGTQESPDDVAEASPSLGDR